MIKEKQQLMICLTALAVIGGFVLFRFFPLHKKSKAVKQEKSVQTLAIAKGISDSEQLPVFMQQLHSLKEKLSNFEANIPRERALGTFVQEIAELMNQNDLKDQEIAPNTEIEADGLNCIPVSIQCKGGLTQIFQFYQQLQEMNRLVRVEQIKLTNDNDFIGEVSMKTDVVIYYRTDTKNG